MTLNQGAVSLDANGIVRLTSDVLGVASVEFDVTSSGLILRDTVTASPNNLFMRFIEDSGFPVTLANFGYVASDIFTIDGLSTQVNINTNSPSGVLISHIGVNVFQTFVGGFKTLGTRFEVDNDGADTLASVRVRNLTGGVDLRVAPGGNASISQLVGTTGGFEDDWINFTRNGAVGLNFNNVTTLETTSRGIDVLTETGNLALLDIVGDGLNSDGILGLRGDSGGAIYKWDESQLTARLRSTTSSGLEQETFIDMVVDGAVNVYYNGLLVYLAHRSERLPDVRWRVQDSRHPVRGRQRWCRYTSKRTST